jgi:uncharacterized protein
MAGVRTLIVVLIMGLSAVGAAAAPAPVPAPSPQSQAPSADLPELAAPVNDFAHVIDGASAQAIDQLSRSLKAATGDVVIVATIQTVEPYADVQEYAVKLFENHGRGIGEKGKDNGVLILLAVKERRVWIEVGYGLEQWITDGFAGETSRDYMAPEFRNGQYGAGLLNGASRMVGRIAEGRGVTITGADVSRDDEEPQRHIPLSGTLIFFIVILLMSRMAGGPGRGIRRWGGGGWSGWSSGIGPFGGGGFGGGGGGGGFGGGFGGFGGGGSGGGGGGAGW